MEIFINSLIIIICLLALIDLAIAGRFIHAIRSQRGVLLEDRDCPPVAVILCLRGADPSLESCLHGILDQDYPDYYLHVIVDNENDPAMAVLNKIRSPAGRIRILTESLKDILPHCSLKCSGQIQAIHHIGPEYKILVFIDADTLPQRYWLRSLVSPLVKENYGAVNGVRWYAPHHNCTGSIIRYIWNAGAQTLMLANKIAWGGSLAIHRERIDQNTLISHWSKSLCEDTSLNTILESSGRTLGIIPSLVMLNNEKIDVMSFMRFLKRQLITARLHHRQWPLIVIHGLFVLFAVPVSLITITVSATAGLSGRYDLLLFVLLAYVLMLLGMLVSGEITIQRALYHQANNHSITVYELFHLFICIPLTQIIYSLVMFQTILADEVEWRGVRYSLLGKDRIQLIQYEPYRQSAPEEKQSL